jgi:hypothetical protein
MENVLQAIDSTTPRTRASFDESTMMSMDYAEPPSSHSRTSRRRTEMGIGIGISSIMGMGMGSKARTVSSPSSFGLQSWFGNDDNSNIRGKNHNFLPSSSRSILDTAFFAPPPPVVAGGGDSGGGRPALSVRTEQMAPSPEMRIPGLTSSPTTAGPTSAFPLSTRTRRGMVGPALSPEAMSKRTRSRSSQGTIKPEPEGTY